MKSTVETLSPTRVRLNVEVPFDELKPSLDKAYKTIAGQIVIPGFRKGKVPPRLIDQRVGRAAVLEETLNEAIPSSYSEAVKEHDVKVIGRPEVEVTELNDGENVIFTAEVEVRPELTLPDFAGLNVTVDDVKVTDEDVAEQIDGLRDRFASLKTVERAAGNGDFVTMDLRATVNGDEVPGGTADGVSHEVGSGKLLDGLDEALVGLSAGESATFSSSLIGGDHAGNDAEVAVTVKTVKEKELPELDDEFAETASEFDTLEELRASMRERLDRVKRLEQAVQARDKALAALLAEIEVPLPEKLLETEIEHRKEHLQEALDRANVTLERYLEREGESQEEFDATLRTDAETAVKTQLVLDAIADAEQLGVDDSELTNEVVRRSQQSGVAPQQYADQLVQSGQLPVVVSDLRRGKALALVVEAAKIADESGEPVDLDVLRTELADAGVQ